MSEFLLIFRGGDAQRVHQSPEEMQTHMQKWGAWMENMSKNGQLIGGQPLKQSGKMMTNQGETITDGPYAEGSEIVGGYMLIKGNSYDEALAIAKKCPIFEHQGTVEVREIMPMEF